MHIVRLARNSALGPAITVGAKLFEGLNLVHGDRIRVCCGQSSLDGVSIVRGDRGAKDVVYFSNDLLYALPLPVPLRLRVKRDEDGSLRFGPFVGILARSTRSPSQRFMSQTPYFASLVRMGKRLAIPTYVITPEGLDWQRQRVHAWSIQGGGWHRLYLPLPDVVYDRIQTRRLDLMPGTQRAKSLLGQEQGIKIFNTGFLDKWETHAVLETEATQRYLPETKLLTDDSDLYRFTQRYRTVFVKPAGGSLGQGIFVLQRRSGKRFTVTHYGTQRVSRFQIPSPAPIWRRLRRLKQKRRYVVQQGLQFARYRGCRFDMRLLAQKGGENEWKITAMYARVAPPGSLRANLDAGGKAINSRRVLRRIFGRASGRVARRIVQAGLAVARAMEDGIEGTIGELGIDIGVDRAGRPWLIEANSKPLRQMEGPAQRLARTLRRPLQYARHLSGF